MQVNSKLKKAIITGRPLTKGCVGGLYLPYPDGMSEFVRLDTLKITIGQNALRNKFGVLATGANVQILNITQESEPLLFEADIPAFKSALHLITQGYSLDLSPILKCVDIKAPFEPLHNLAEKVEGQGYYLGLWEPRDKKGNSLCRLFDVYAAPIDLPGNTGKRAGFTFNEAVEHTARLTNWFNHQGLNLSDEDALFEAIESGSPSIINKWIIPPICLLAKDPLYENAAHYTYLERFYNSAELGESYAKGENICQYYWSCSLDKSGSHPPRRMIMSVKHESKPKMEYEDKSGLSTRLIRLVPRAI